MVSPVARIVPLPPDVVAQIKSSTAIPSLTSVVLGLIENALDAGSSRIDIEIDFARGSCVVEDDGNGIAPEDFAETGGLGKSCCKSGRLIRTSSFTENYRYVQAWERNVHSWNEWLVSRCCSRIVHSDNHLPPFILSVAFNTYSSSFATSC